MHFFLGALRDNMNNINEKQWPFIGWILLYCKWYEWLHDKTKYLGSASAKTQISQGIHPVWSECSLSASKKLGNLYFRAQGRLTRIGILVSTGHKSWILGYVMVWLIWSDLGSPDHIMTVKAYITLILPWGANWLNKLALDCLPFK